MIGPDDSMCQTDLIESVSVRHVCDVDGLSCSFTIVDDIEVNKTLTECQLRT